MSMIDSLELARVTGGYERASTWDAKSGHYVSTDDYKKWYGVDSVCHNASCYDSKSGHFISGDDWNQRQQQRPK